MRQPPIAGFCGPYKLDQAPSSQVAEIPPGCLARALELGHDLGLAELTIGPHLLNGPLLALVVY